tara:strand:- start:2091 stop:2615 length:525 start_codon:yes stop_codon:yes gene_type:complete
MQVQIAKSKLKLSLLTILPRYHADWTLAAAREYVAEGATLPGGTSCPCCGQKAAVYTRAFNLMMAKSVQWAVDKYGMLPEPLDMQREAPPWLVRNREYNRTRYWGLLNRVGRALWVPTEAARRFVNARDTIWSHALVYNDRVVAFVGDRVCLDNIQSLYDAEEISGASGVKADG